MQELCELYPDNKLFNTIQITRHIRTGTENEKDLEIINQLLNRDGFSDYPKLLLLQAYYQNIFGKQYDTGKIYNLYNNGATFYPEDQLNLAWLLYSNGEFGKAYKIATDAYKESNNDALLLLSEILLRDDNTLSIDKRKLLSELTTISTEWYNDDSQLRFQLVSLLVAKKAGISIDVSEIASKSLSLFDGNEFNDIFIQASLAFEGHDYKRCNDLCGQMLELEVPGKDKHRILFLKTDALLALAEEDPNYKEDYLTQAKEAMEVVQNDVEDDYVNCLKRLRDIYEMSGDDESRNEITERLLQFS